MEPTFPMGGTGWLMTDIVEKFSLRAATGSALRRNEPVREVAFCEKFGHVSPEAAVGLD
jgi:hypothetical protein